MDSFGTAKLTQDVLQSIKRLETQISQELDQQIALVAYSKDSDTKHQPAEPKGNA